LIADFEGHRGLDYSAEFSPDGKRIVTAGSDNTARIWDIETRKTAPVLTGHTGPVFSAAFSPDGQRVVTASADKTAQVWDGKQASRLFLLSRVMIDRCGALRSALTVCAL
jgi:WD40 repeat protein